MLIMTADRWRRLGDCVAAVLYKSFPVAGVEADGDDLKVVGKCSDGQVDHDGDIVSPSWMAAAVKDWLGTFPAVRMQHRHDYPAGRGLEAWQDRDGSTWLKSLIVDDKAKKLVKSGVLRAYSIGVAEPKTRPHVKASRYEIYGGRLVEVSVCDSPSNARCGIEVCKSVGGSARYVGRAWGKPPKLAKTEKQALAAAVAAEDAFAATCLKSADPVIRMRAETYLAERHG